MTVLQGIPSAYGKNSTEDTMQSPAASGVYIILKVQFVYMIKVDVKSVIWESDC